MNDLPSKFNKGALTPQKFLEEVKKGNLTSYCRFTLESDTGFIRGDVFSNVEVNADNGVARGVLRIDGGSNIGDVISPFSSGSMVKGVFKNIDHHNNIYAGHHKNLNNKIFFHTPEGDFTFYKVSITRKGSLDRIFTFIAQANTNEIKKFDKML